MAKKWRLIRLEVHNAFENMAIDHVLLEKCFRGEGQNTLRLYRWMPSAVSIGRFQRLHEEVNMEACYALGIDVVRRMSGGGAVYHDYDGELTYSVICRMGGKSGAGGNIPSDVVASYKYLCQGLIRGLGLMGLRVEFASGSARVCPNLVVRSRKISGNAQSRRGTALLQHGTILRRLDLQRMFTVLKTPSPREGCTITQYAATRLTSLEQELGFVPSFSQLEEALVEGFAEALNIEFEEEPLTQDEYQSALQLARTHYASREWTLQW